MQYNEVVSMSGKIKLCVAVMQVENKHYSTVSGLIRLVIISRMLY